MICILQNGLMILKSWFSVPLKFVCLVSQSSPLIRAFLYLVSKKTRSKWLKFELFLIQAYLTQPNK